MATATQGDFDQGSSPRGNDKHGKDSGEKTKGDEEEQAARLDARLLLGPVKYKSGMCSRAFADAVGACAPAAGHGAL